ncbi:MAG: adenosine kinase [Hyphomicrobiales bacterium]|nr:adenosine kinase [Hyphomicrobiales bacterium]
MTRSPKFDVVGIGNAIVDVIARAEDDFLVANGIRKGGMTLIDEQAAARLYQSMGSATVASGGSAANTMVGLASLGGRAAFIGKVRNDEPGSAFRHDIGAVGVHFPTPAATSGAPTARCLVLVTPDGERTMSTYLGACVELGPLDIDAALIADAHIVYLEGYLWDPPQAKEAFRQASQAAHAAGARVALTLSDSFCVDRYRDEFLELIRTGVIDIVFANESELHALYQTSDFETAVNALRKERLLSFVTRSAEGCLVVDHGASIAVPSAPIEQLIDTTGAGDLFAAGALFGLARGKSLEQCAAIGALAAAEVIQHIGARPARSLADLLAQSAI